MSRAPARYVCVHCARCLRFNVVASQATHAVCVTSTANGKFGASGVMANLTSLQLAVVVRSVDVHVARVHGLCAHAVVSHSFVRCSGTPANLWRQPTAATNDDHKHDVA